MRVSKLLGMKVIDRNTVQSMKNFDATHWGHLNDLNRDQFINRPSSTR